jgi:serine/threonine-protein kinase
MSETFGAWELEGLIAVGGLGEVWRANRSGEIAALKRMHTHLARNDEARAQFALEQRLAIALPRHPNLVHAIEAGDVGGRQYVALELAPGIDLRRLLATGATLPRERAIAIVACAADAIAHVHASGWILGDVNPGNLVVELDRAAIPFGIAARRAHVPTRDSVVVIDLNVAREIDAPASAVRGTHAYMAPEQVRGERWTPATDVFALGVVLWELISGARLFHRGPPWLSMAAVVEQPAPPLDDPQLDAIARAALAKPIDDRLASADELARRLRAL